MGVIATLVVLEPYTGVGGEDAITGFANPATVTIVAMYMLSAGIQNTGLVQRLGLYRSVDFVKVGGPLQLLLAVVTAAGIVVIWGL